jgi:hypothetical protein
LLRIVRGAGLFETHLASLVCQLACLPDERHITGPKYTTAIVDKDRGCTGDLDVHLVAKVSIV